MLEVIRNFVHTHTGGLTDGQFFGFGIMMFVLIVFALIALARRH